MASANLDISGVLSKLTSFENKFDAALSVFAENGAQKMEEYAKKNRKWTDRTARARQSLNGKAFKIDNGYRLQIAHGVHYGVYLEYRYGRKYAILDTTVRSVGNGQILPALGKFIERTCKV